MAIVEGRALSFLKGCSAQRRTNPTLRIQDYPAPLASVVIPLHGLPVLSLFRRRRRRCQRIRKMATLLDKIVLQEKDKVKVSAKGHADADASVPLAPMLGSTVVHPSGSVWAAPVREEEVFGATVRAEDVDPIKSHGHQAFEVAVTVQREVV